MKNPNLELVINNTTKLETDSPEDYTEEEKALVKKSRQVSWYLPRGMQEKIDEMKRRNLAHPPQEYYLNLGDPSKANQPELFAQAIKYIRDFTKPDENTLYKIDTLANKIHETALEIIGKDPSISVERLRQRTKEQISDTCNIKIRTETLLKDDETSIDNLMSALADKAILTSRSERKPSSEDITKYVTNQLNICFNPNKKNFGYSAATGGPKYQDWILQKVREEDSKGDIQAEDIQAIRFNGGAQAIKIFASMFPHGTPQLITTPAYPVVVGKLLDEAGIGHPPKRQDTLQFVEQHLNLCHTSPENNWKITYEMLKDSYRKCCEKTGHKPKALHLTSPNNPTSLTTTIEEMDTITDFLRAHDMVAFEDTTYKNIKYPRSQEEANSIIYDSASIFREKRVPYTELISGSKDIGFPGGRLAQLIFHPNGNELINRQLKYLGKRTNAHMQDEVSPATMSEKITPEIYKDHLLRSFLARNNDLYARNSELMRNHIINEMDDIFNTPPLPNGAFYLFLPIKEEILKKEFNIPLKIKEFIEKHALFRDEALAYALWALTGIVVSPGGGFFTKQLGLRIPTFEDYREILEMKEDGLRTILNQKKPKREI